MGATESLPFTQGEEVLNPHVEAGQVNLWRHYTGTRIQTQEQVSIFVFPKSMAIAQTPTPATSSTPNAAAASAAAAASSSTSPTASSTGTPVNFGPLTDAQALTLAKTQVQRLKTLRHPHVLKYIDSVEIPTHIFLVTEPVQSVKLVHMMSNEAHTTSSSHSHSKSSASVSASVSHSDLKPNILAASLGLYQITTALHWLHEQCKMIHHNIHPGVVYQTKSGDWKLSGLEACHKMGETLPDHLLIARTAGLLPVKYRAPEIATGSKTGNSNMAATETTGGHSIDAWSMGCLIFHTFHASFTSPQQLTQSGSIPPTLLNEYKKLLGTNPLNRLTAAKLLESAFFQNELVKTVTFLEKLALKNSEEKDHFFQHFSKHVLDFPVDYNKYKILPQLTLALDYGSGLSSVAPILTSIVKIGSLLSPTEYAEQVIPSLLKLFTSQERAIRVHLLQHLPEYISHLSTAVINDQLFTHVLTGLTDAHALLRELTVKSLVHFSSKLNPTHMDTTLKHLAKLQTDNEPAIRTNTTYCIAKLAPFLNAATQERILIPAFTRALKDPFPPARVAGLMSLLATLELHTADNVAKKIIPVIAPSTVEEPQEVRASAMKLMRASVDKLAKHQETLDQAAAAAATAAAAANRNNAAANGVNNPNASNGASGAAAGNNLQAQLLENTSAVLGSFGNWAISSVKSKLVGDQKVPSAGPVPSTSANTTNTNTTAAPTRPTPSHASTPSTGGSNSSFSVLAATNPNTASSSSNAGSKSDWSDDFFDDFEADSNKQDDDDSTTVALSLGTKKGDKKERTSSFSSTAASSAPVRKSSAGPTSVDKTSTKPKSILSKTGASPIISATSNTSASNDWDIFDDLGGGGKKASTATKEETGNAWGDDDGDDDWGSSISQTPVSTTTSNKASGSSDLSALLSSSTRPKSTSSSSSSSVDAFANLATSSSSSSSSALSRPASSSLHSSTGSLSLKSGPGTSSIGAKKPSILASSTTSPSTTTTVKKPSISAMPASSSKGGDADDWNDFLNS